jgi:phthalate 4,5-dioxygenase
VSRAVHPPRMHRLLLRAAKGLAAGGVPPALGGTGDFRSIRGAEKVLADGEDWRVLGTNDDPVVREAVQELPDIVAAAAEAH